MNQKQLTILLVLVVIIGGLGLVVYKRSSASWEGSSPASAGGKVLGDFALNDVARVVIKSNVGSVTVAKKNDTWAVQDRGDYPADFARVGNFIQGLWDLKAVQEQKVGPSQLGRLELTSPENGTAGTGTLVELQDKDSKPVGTILLGKKAYKKSEMDSASGFPGMEGGFAVGRYVMPTAGVNVSKVVLVSDVLSQAEPKPEEWLNKMFIRIDRIQSVVLSGSTPALQWKLNRATDEATEWKLADAKPDEKVDTAKVPSFASTLGAPTFEDVLTPDAKPLDKPTTVTVDTFDHLTYTLKIGAPEGNNYPVSVVLNADLPKARTPGKDEKPEDKKKLDESFAAKNKELADKVAKEKAFEKRIYLISKSSFDSLLKNRADLLEEKKPAPTPSPAPSASPSPAVIPAAPAPPTVSASGTPVSVTTPPVGLPEVRTATATATPAPKAKAKKEK